MAALPWAQAQTIDPNREYVAMASRLPLKAYRFVPAFSATRCASAASCSNTGPRRLRPQRATRAQDVLDLLRLGRRDELAPIRRYRPASQHHQTAPTEDERDPFRVLHGCAVLTCHNTWHQMSAPVR
jgi:hypothetical protein